MSQTEKTKCPSQSLKSARVTDTRDNSQFHICIELLILYINTEPLCTHMASLYYSLTVGGDAIFYRGRGRSDVWKHGVQRRAEHRGALPLLRGPGRSEGGRSQRGRRGMWHGGTSHGAHASRCAGMCEREQASTAVCMAQALACVRLKGGLYSKSTPEPVTDGLWRCSG